MKKTKNFLVNLIIVVMVLLLIPTFLTIINETSLLDDLDITTTETSKQCETCILDDGVVLVEATCTSNGKVKYTCKVCNSETLEVVPKLFHSFVECEDEYIEGSCDNREKITEVCSVCEYKYSYELDYWHEWNFAQETPSCNLCGKEYVRGVNDDE